MSRPRSYRSEGVVLKATHMGEGAVMITLYSQSLGKLRAIARGARKPSSKMVGHLEPLNRVELAVARARVGGIDTVTQAQVVEAFPDLKASLEGVSRGLYLAELVDGFGTEGGANPELYCLLLDALRFLNHQPEADTALRYFELHLLQRSGFMPELYRCVECHKELVAGEHLFSPDVGGTLCSSCTPQGVRVMRLSVQALKVLRHFGNVSVAEIQRLPIQVSLALELKNLLAVTLRYWLDKEVRSRRFMEQLEKVPSVPGVQGTG